MASATEAASGATARRVDRHQNSLSTTKRARSASSAHAGGRQPAPSNDRQAGVEVVAGKRLGGLPGRRSASTSSVARRHGGRVERPVQQQPPQLVGPVPSAGAQGEDHRERLLAGGRSLPSGLPVRSGSPQMPRMSSTAWNATPSWAP